MERFVTSKTQIKTLVIGFVCSLILIILGIGTLIYDANNSCEDFVKFSGIMYLIGGACFLFSITMNYANTVTEVIFNEDYLCINKPGLTSPKSEIIKYSDIISVDSNEKRIPLLNDYVTTIVLNTKLGTKPIVNIEKTSKFLETVNQKISSCNEQIEKDD